jgi:hypothetical protein
MASRQTGTDPKSRWEQLNGRYLHGDERACRDLASRLAYRAQLTVHEGHPDLGPGVYLRRGPGWYDLAVDAYALLRESGAFGHLAGLVPRTCAAPEPILRAWLTGASQEPDSLGQPIADLLHLGDAFSTVNDTTAADHLNMLIQAGQQYAVFGHPAHLISLAHTGTTGLVRIVVDTPHGPALASAPLPVGELLPLEGSGVDAAIAALTAVASRVNILFVDHARAAWTHPPGHLPDHIPPRPSRPFPALGHEEPTTPPPAEGTAISPIQPHQHRSR